ncbi:MAG: DNA polymerase III subunit gamma/tau [Candidatus Pacebacteria bacterium]|nr:DNA polymerase III subunit gamma/tau [Candidatus Paceibacterota bacterium]
MNLVLYRKYRPKTFAEVVGQGPIIQTLTNAIAKNMIGHGYLFSGSHGCGKTSVARLFAKSINCQNRKDGEFEPCNKCESCLEINQGNAIDLIEIDAASNRGIDEMRELKEGIRFRPVKSKYKVFIIDEAHQLTKEAANALLKTLEEPPAHAVFILATTELHKMIPTIQSRCQQFSFRKLKLPELVGRLEHILKQEKIKFEKAALEMIAQKASGSVRDAETLLDQAISFSGCEPARNASQAGSRSDAGEGVLKTEIVQAILGVADKTAIFNFLDFLQNKNAKSAFELLTELRFSGVDLKEFVGDLIEHLREALFLKIDPNQESALVLVFTAEEKAKLLNLAQKYTEQELKNIIDLFMTAENKMKYASIIQLPLELAVVDCCFGSNLNNK